jgi:Tfp pilus assembly protein PilO
MNKYLAQIADVQWLNIMIAGIVAAVAYYFLMFDDGSSLKTQIQQGKQRVVEAQKQLEQTEKAMQDAQKFEREVRETAKQFESIVDYMPLNLSAADLHSTITKNASLAGVHVVKLEPKDQDTVSDFYQMTRMKMTIEGTFAQIVSFLANLSRAPNLLTLESSELKNGKSADGTQSLLFESVLVGYRYLREDQASAAATAGTKGAKGKSSTAKPGAKPELKPGAKPGKAE